MFVHLFESINLLSKFFQRYRLCVHFAFFSPDPDTDAEVCKSDNNANDGYDSQVPCLFVHLVMVVNDDGYNSQVAGLVENLLLRIVVSLVTRLHRVVAHGEAGDITF